MMIDHRPSVSLESIQATIVSNPNAAQLIPGSDGKSLVLPGLFSRLSSFYDGSKMRQQARNILRTSIAQKYDSSLARRVCPPVHDHNSLSALQADRILKMATVIYGKQSAYPLSNIHDEQMSLITHARDAGLVAEESIAKLINKKATLLEVLKAEALPSLKKEEAFKKHPEFIAAKEEAIQATQYAAEAVEEVVRGLKERAIADFSFGIQAALAAAQHHAAMARRAIVVTGEEKDLDYKATEALAAATDVHDAYQVLQESQRGSVSQVEDSGALEGVKAFGTAAARKERLQQTLKKIEAVKEYAAQVDEHLGDLCSMMATFDPFASVPITHACVRMRPILEDATTQAQQLVRALAEEEQMELSSRPEDVFCREAAVQRFLASSQRTISALESAIENARSIAANKTELFMNTHPMMRSYLDSIDQAQEAYQAR